METIIKQKNNIFYINDAKYPLLNQCEDLYDEVILHNYNGYGLKNILLMNLQKDKHTDYINTLLYLTHKNKDFEFIKINLREYIKIVKYYNEYSCFSNSSFSDDIDIIFDFILENDIKDIKQFLKIKNYKKKLKFYFRIAFGHKKFDLKFLKKRVYKYSFLFRSLHVKKTHLVFNFEFTPDFINYFYKEKSLSFLRKTRLLGIHFFAYSFNNIPSISNIDNNFFFNIVDLSEYSYKNLK